MKNHLIEIRGRDLDPKRKYTNHHAKISGSRERNQIESRSREPKTGKGFKWEVLCRVISDNVAILKY